eukprot:712323-Pleurochrysis_carterae.AAC.4
MIALAQQPRRGQWTAARVDSQRHPTGLGHCGLPRLGADPSYKPPCGARQQIVGRRMQMSSAARGARVPPRQHEHARSAR